MEELSLIYIFWQLIKIFSQVWEVDGVLGKLESLLFMSSSQLGFWRNENFASETSSSGCKKMGFFFQIFAWEVSWDMNLTIDWLKWR